VRKVFQAANELHMPNRSTPAYFDIEGSQLRSSPGPRVPKRGLRRLPTYRCRLLISLVQGITMTARMSCSTCSWKRSGTGIRG
jgi:hypothetical protein